MTPAGYNLLIDDVPDHPYVGPPPSMVYRRLGPNETPVELASSYHHIVPKSPTTGLIKLWNEVVKLHNVGEVAVPLLIAINRNADKYSMNKVPADLDRVKQIANDIRFRRIIHDPPAPGNPQYVEGWDHFTETYVWLPGNLFTGPSRRIDDLGEAFDEPAEHIIINTRQYGLLNDVYINIGKYLKDPAKKGYAETAYKKLGQIAMNYLAITPFSTADWTLKSVREANGVVDRAKVLPKNRRKHG